MLYRSACGSIRNPQQIIQNMKDKYTHKKYIHEQLKTSTVLIDGKQS